MKEIKIQVDDYEIRKNLITYLGMLGKKVCSVKERPDYYSYEKHYVRFEISEDEIIDVVGGS